MNYRFFTLCAACLFACFCLSAGPTEGIGKVVDSFTRELLSEFRADLLRPDSTLIRSYGESRSRSFNQIMNLTIDSVPESGGILRVSATGYYTAYMNINPVGKDEWAVELWPVMMHRIPFYKPTELEEVSVVASRVKMISRGDTIVYNADAFALAKGSMLDGLIDQLPGVELKSDGRILVNGEFVSELLVNGDSFFKGDPKIALENLPAYMVKDVQVYHQNDRREQKPLSELPLVMDVSLKKQFQAGWIANAEAGYGTENRYVGRAFAMMFTRDSRLSVVGSVNNTNDDRKPGQTDNWNPDWQSAGRASVASGGLDYLWNSRMRTWKVEANALAKYKRSDIESNGITERYISGNNLTGTQNSSKLSREVRISSENRISFHVPRIWASVSPVLRFIRERTSSAYSSTMVDASTELLNSLSETGSAYQRSWLIGASADLRWQLPRSNDALNITAAVRYRNVKLEESSLRILQFPLEQSCEQTEPLQHLPRIELKADATANYGMGFTYGNDFSGSLSFDYKFEHENVNTSRSYWVNESPDAPNSFDCHTVESQHDLTVRFHTFCPKPSRWQSENNPQFHVQARLSHRPGHIDYTTMNKVHSARRSPWLIIPNVRIEHEPFGELTYEYESVLPRLMELIDIADNANPLYKYMGNNALKNERVHKFGFRINLLERFDIRLRGDFNRYENMIMQSVTYDMTNGITTFRPVNVSGNWDLSGQMNFNRRFGHDEKWRLESTTKALYQHSVDLIDETVSTVRNLNLSEKLRLTFKIADGMELTVNGNAEWRRSTSPMPDFVSVSAVDFDYGATFRAAKLPWNVSFNTDLMMHSRRGYADRRLNTNDLVWNARVAKSLLQGNLIFALDGFDILGRLSNVRLTMNAQGRTEMRYNTLPRYGMLHIIYRLNLQPKKK